MSALRVRRPLLSAIVAAVAAALLAGCTASVVDEGVPAARSTASAATAGAACPAATQVAALTAVPFTAAPAGTASCRYAAGEGVERAAIVVHRGGAEGALDLAAQRKAVEGHGVRVRRAARFSPDAFTAARSTGGCTAWVYARDGVITGITATRGSGVAVPACTLATTAAVLVGTATRAAVPIVSVLAPDGLLASTGSTDAWTTAVGRTADARVRLVTGAGTGYLPASGTGFTTAAARIDPGSAAVVLLSDGSDAGRNRLALLRAATRALSAAASAAPGARLIVAGPVRTSGTSEADLRQLRTDLRAAAHVAGAQYVDPAVQPSGTRTSDRARQVAAAASGVARLLHTDLR